MNSLKKTALLVAMTLPLTFSATSALAKGGSGFMGDGPQFNKRGNCGMAGERGIWRELNLTTEQQQQMQQLRQTNRDNMQQQMQADRSQRQAEQQQMNTLVMADNFDEASVRNLVEQMNAKQADKRVAMAKARHDMFSVLTAEQKQQFQTLQAEKHQQCMDKWQARQDRRATTN